MFVRVSVHLFKDQLQKMPLFEISDARLSSPATSQLNKDRIVEIPYKLNASFHSKSRNTLHSSLKREADLMALLLTSSGLD